MMQRLIAAGGLIGCLLLSVQGGEKTRTVPLDQIGATTGQKGIKKMTAAMDGAGKYVEPYGKALAEIQQLGRNKPSVALVTGKDLTAAVEAWRGLVSERKEGPNSVEAKGTDTLWIGAYLGTNGSSPPAFEVEAVEIKGKTIRIAYKKGAAFTNDVHHYLVWAPLGKCEAGTYTLELFETKSKEVTLKRECKVTLK